MICTATAGAFMKKSAITSGGEGLIKGFSWHAYPAGRVCSHLWWGESYNRLNQHGSPPGRSFYSCKRNQNTLGALPQDPCRWLCWIRIDLRREPKINPYCAQNRSQGSLRQHLPFPPTPFPDGGKGARMGGQVQGGSLSLGVLGLAKTASR